MIVKTDNIEFLKKHPDNFYDIIITSPPYNLGNVQKGDIRVNSYKDNYKEKEYQKQQLRFLKEAYRVLRSPGAFFYIHKNRYIKNTIISPYTWLLKTKFKIKQEIIWNKSTTPDRWHTKFSPYDEKIFWLYKDTTFNLKRGAQNFGNIWHINRPKRHENKGHKATFPKQLIYRILNSLNVDKNATFVLDPYAGTGTTCQVANALNFKKNICLENNDKWVKVAEIKEWEPLDFDEEIPKITHSYKSNYWGRNKTDDNNNLSLFEEKNE